MKNKIGIQSVSVIGAIISIVTIVEGSSVMLGISVPTNIVVPALLWYNIFFGMVGIGISITLWSNPAKISILVNSLAALHSIVFIIVSLFHFVAHTTAIESVKAMFFRSVVWIIIAMVTLISNKRENENTVSNDDNIRRSK